jgi:hypothetical protein
MAKISRQVGTTSLILEIFLQDTTSTTGAGKTGLTNATSGLNLSYKRNTGTAAVNVATVNSITTFGTFAGTSTQGAFKEVDSTNLPGVYELHIPNNALASGADSVLVMLSGMTGVAPLPLEIELTATSNQDEVHGGMTALPNTACTTNASLITSGNGTDQLSVSGGKVLLQATQTGVTIPTVTTVTNQLTAAQIATGVWQDSNSGDFTVASSIGKSLYTSGAVPGASGGLFLAGSNAATTVNITGSLSGSVGSVSGNVGGISGVTFPSGFSSLTTAAIATAVWTDTTGSDFATTSSPGKIIVTQLGNAFTNTTGSIYNAAALQNAPSGGGGDPWATSLPGSYTAGQAGYIVGHNLDTNVGSRMATFTLPTNFSSLSIDGTGLVTLAAAGLDQISVESGVNARQALAVIGAACAGKASGLGSNTPAYTGMNNNTMRIAASTDSSGDRTSVTLTLP